MTNLIRFPQERCAIDSRAEPGNPCLILILPVVRIERDDSPLLGRRQTRRCRRAIDKLRDPKR